jgi:uncharacterized protein YjbI with pentapeptide repeats
MLAAGALLVLAAAAPTGVAAATYRDCSGLTLAAGADLHRCDISGTTFIGEDLAGVNLARANLSGVFGGCDPDEPRTNLTGAVIYRAVATGARLCDAILTSADLHGTDFRNASFEDATLRGANLSRAILDGAGVQFADLRTADVSNVSAVGLSGTGVNLDGADAHRIDLRDAVLNGSSLVGTDLRYARLAGADFSGADLTGATWRHATGAASATWADTICPDGTNSDDHGATCVGH